jgi:hypothetical protein
LSFLLFFGLSASAQQPSQQAPQQTLPSQSGERIIKLYPNPAVTYITFDLQRNFKSGWQIQVYNGVLGKKVYEAKITFDKFVLNLSEYSRGIYIYHLVDQTGFIVESGKFQVSK